jgi:predicted DNA-binding ribbon-helix-helix protein
MKRPALSPHSRARLLQKHLILRKRRNHWQIVFDHLIATPAEDRIGDPAEAVRQLNDLYRQLAALNRVLGIKNRGRQTKSQTVKRSIIIAGRKTNVSLEDAFWHSFKDLADERRVTLSQLAAEIRAIKTTGTLSSAIRLFVLGLYRDRLSELQK